MKYNIFIFAYDPEALLAQTTADCLKSVIECSKGEDYEIRIITEKGIVQAINRAWREATGEYIVMLNNDLIIRDPHWLQKLTNPGAITGWQISTNHFTKLTEPHGACYAMQKLVQEKIGEVDELFANGYGFDDVDYFLRARDLGIPFIDGAVKLDHQGNVTWQKYRPEWKEGGMAENAEKFWKKWAKRTDLVNP